MLKFPILKKYYLIIFVLLLNSRIYAEENTEKNIEQYTEIPVVSFKSGAFFNISLNYNYELWKIINLGIFENYSSVFSNYGLKIKYLYFMNIEKKFGFLIGSDMSLAYTNKKLTEFNNQAQISPNLVIQFPSLILGLVQNFKTNERIFIYFMYSTKWYPYFSSSVCPLNKLSCNINDNNFYDKTLGTAMRTIALTLQYEHFFTNYALSFAIMYSKSTYKCDFFTDKYKTYSNNETNLNSMRFWFHSINIELGLTIPSSKKILNY